MELDADARKSLLKEYEDRRPVYQQALSDLNHSLTEVLGVMPSGNRRFKVEAGRIKSGPRLWAKLVSRASSGELDVRPLEGVDELIRSVVDVVGTRITCNTTLDVTAAVEHLLETCSGEDPPLILHESDPRDYIATPKPSGYRGVHLIMAVPVTQGVSRPPVICEVQVRTLLQDAWGELTHEDTYKPGMRVPPIVDKLSTRLATVLAVMDELAADIRLELDRDVAASVEDERSEHQAGVPPDGTSEPVPEPSVDHAGVGDTVVGEVVSTGQDFALVVLPDGRRGILHHTGILGVTGFVAVDQLVAVGDSVFVELTSIDESEQRIVLAYHPALS